jgi:hypothetical protein
MEQLVMWAGAAMAAVILMRHPGVYAPALAWEGRPGTPDDDEEQVPETDRSPRGVPGVHLVHRWLPGIVACVAALRLALLVTLHA